MKKTTSTRDADDEEACEELGDSLVEKDEAEEGLVGGREREGERERERKGERDRGWFGVVGTVWVRKGWLAG